MSTRGGRKSPIGTARTIDPVAVDIIDCVSIVAMQIRISFSNFHPVRSVQYRTEVSLRSFKDVVSNYIEQSLLYVGACL